VNHLDQIEALVTEAEASERPEPILQGARDLLAQVALAGEKLDPERLEALAMRCSKNSGDHTTPRQLILWGNFMGCCVDLLREGVVGMKDGRMATADGWDYGNCQPERIHPQISRQLIERLNAYVGTLTDDEGSNDPDNNPDEFDEKFDEAVEHAVTEYLNKQGFPQLWQGQGNDKGSGPVR